MSDNKHYLERIRRVLDFIDSHTTDTLDIRSLSAIAAFSPFHFQRQFSALTGLSVLQYVRLIRMKRAASQLAFRRDMSITSIALDSGYMASDTFSRAFRQLFHQSPSEFRQTPNAEQWHRALAPLDRARRLDLSQSHRASDVLIQQRQEIPIAVMEHYGPKETLHETIRAFIDWRQDNRLPPHKAASFTLFYTDPEYDPPDKQRIGLCVAYPCDRPLHDNRLKRSLLPGGRCAVKHVQGFTEDLLNEARSLYRDWLPTSGEEPCDHPLFCERLSLFPDVGDHETMADLILPLQKRTEQSA